MSILKENTIVNDNLLCCGRNLFIQPQGNRLNQPKNLDAIQKPQRILCDQDIKSGRTSSSASFLISNLAIFQSLVSIQKTFAKHIAIISCTHISSIRFRLILR